jgi:hypothetical protein
MVTRCASSSAETGDGVGAPAPGRAECSFRLARETSCLHVGSLFPRTRRWPDRARRTPRRGGKRLARMGRASRAEPGTRGSATQRVRPFLGVTSGANRVTKPRNRDDHHQQGDRRRADGSPYPAPVAEGPSKTAGCIGPSKLEHVLSARADKYRPSIPCLPMARISARIYRARSQPCRHRPA